MGCRKRKINELLLVLEPLVRVVIVLALESGVLVLGVCVLVLVSYVIETSLPLTWNLVFPYRVQ